MSCLWKLGMYRVENTVSSLLYKCCRGSTFVSETVTYNGSCIAATFAVVAYQRVYMPQYWSRCMCIPYINCNSARNAYAELQGLGLRYINILFPLPMLFLLKHKHRLPASLSHNMRQCWTSWMLCHVLLPYNWSLRLTVGAEGKTREGGCGPPH
jgi:hypothetical protein